MMIRMPNGSIAHVSVPDPELTIDVRGKLIRFEFHEYLGPTPVNKRGDPIELKGHRFWKAVSWWAQQGKRVENGLCVYEEPKVVDETAGMVKVGRNWMPPEMATRHGFPVALPESGEGTGE